MNKPTFHFKQELQRVHVIHVDHPYHRGNQIFSRGNQLRDVTINLVRMHHIPSNKTPETEVGNKHVSGSVVMQKVTIEEAQQTNTTHATSLFRFLGEILLKMGLPDRTIIKCKLYLHFWEIYVYEDFHTYYSFYLKCK